MKKDLLTMLNFFSFLKSRKNSKRRLKIFLILIISIFYTTANAQTFTHPVITSGSFALPAGIDEVTVEAWGAGGAGGAALTGGGLARGAGGGGGGAYAKGKISTIGIQSLPVVVGATNAGGTGNGNAGGASYITGFTSIFNAPGGPGGIANLSSGSAPSGVSGATGAIGSISTANGGASGGGSNSLLSLGLSSGSGGNGANFGAGAGGAGGAGVVSLIGANNSGNPGNIYGGGGAGAASSSNLQNGGSGARGHVNITYTCKTYSLTGISAANVCAATGNTSLVQLTSSAAGLPIGTYSVTYNRSSPAGNGLTATMTVTTAGSGQFTASGLNVVGNSTITVTGLTSIDCSTTNLNNQTTIVVGTTPTITLGATTAKCSSSSAQSTTLPYSAVTNAPTTYSITWNASPSNSFVSVNNASLTSSPINISIPANTQPGTYTGNLTVRNVAGCLSSVYPFTILINANPTIATTGTVTAVCQGTSAQIASLAYTATTNSPLSYSIDWATLTDQGTTAFAFAAGGGTINTINVPANTAPGTYTGVMTILTSNGCSFNQNISLTINALPTIATTGTLTAVCQSASAQLASLTYTATTNSPISYSIDWATLTDQGTTAFAFAAGGGTINTINVPANTAPGTYTGVMTILTSNGCSFNQNISLTINANPTITTSGTLTAVCQSASAQLASLTYTATTNSPISYSIDWATLTDQGTTAFAFAAGGGTINTINVPANTAPGTYTGVMTILTSNGCSFNQNISLTINANPTIATTGTLTAVCQSNSAQLASLTYTATTNSPISYSIDWATLTDQGTTAFAFAAGGGTINTINVPANTAPGTYTGVMTILTSNGCSFNQNISLTINANPTITTTGTLTAVCQRASAQLASLTYTATNNSPISYSIDWATLTDQGTTAFVFAAGGGTINTINVPANTAPGTYTGVMTILTSNGCSFNQNISLTINANPTITTTGTLTAVCQINSAQLASLTYTATTNSPISYSIDWATLTDQGTTAFVFAAGGGTINTINVPANTAPGTYTGVMTILTSNGCSFNQNISLTINANPTITTTGTLTAVCQSNSAQLASLTYTATTNSPISYSIDWATLTDQGTTAFAFAAGGGSINTINVPANTAPGTYTGTMTILTSNGCSFNQNISLTINALPTITTSGTLTAVCQSNSAQLASLTYTATTNSPISYSIDWATLTDQGTTAFAFAAGGGTINTINVPANTAPGTYTGTMTILTSNGCSATQSVSLTVNGSPTISTSGIFAAVCQSASAQTTTLNYNSTTGSPINYAIDWIALTDQGTTPFSFSSGSGTVINVNVPANTAAGTYSGVMTISTANGCPVNQGVSLTVNAVSAPTASATQQPSCENNTGIITVTSPAPGTGYSYSINGVDYSNTSGIFTGLAPGPYNVKVKNNTSGCESPSTPITINVLITKTWNGSVNANWGNASNWTPSGVPLASDCVNIPALATSPIISGTNGSFFANRLTIENNGSLIVQSSNTITVTNEVNVVGNGIFIFENNSSLVQVSNAVNTGNIIYRRNTQPLRRYDLTYWSSPVTRVPAFTLHDLSPQTLGDKYFKFDPLTRWITIYNGAEEMVKGNGYSIRGPQPYDTNLTQVYPGEFVGVPNNGQITGPAAVAEQYNLLGNPYPSAIYADQFIHDNATNLYGTLYFWVHNVAPAQTVPGSSTYYYSNDDYAIYNLSGITTVGSMTGIGAPTPGNQQAPQGYIAAGQGFLAKSKTGQSVVFTNSMRVPGYNSQFYKSAATEKHRIWLNLTNTQGAFKQLLIGYVTGATNSWDNNYDAITINANPYIDFYSINEDIKLVIQGRAIPFVASDTIPLGYRSALEGEFTIAIDHTDGNLDNQVIYLQDNVTKTIHNLKTGGYKFTTTIGVFPDRFVLRYTNPNDAVLGNENFENLNGNISVSVREKNIKLQSFSDKENLQEAAVYDVGGKLLYHKKEIDDKEWLITNLHSGPQVLLVKITLDNGKTVTKKIVYN
ncbi:T9SS sorting signal type C domain-containing protein [Flavobacterium sp. SORGH_AS_0622]|uniref:T9SS sorting signal type C domain-containing protein n=1 Tax=Flavobacterium sp. SORGH_AS_0622 TaxID=3041772 RepID=UPI00278948CB|nr:T9SS sorting signal type C domain-containing protein [Flavobacterium sp. SORGH_AS_0622]MDQ1167890.1 hypothetical protein [Flavobacterium sp. SORGH_AS_0622]